MKYLFQFLVEFSTFQSKKQFLEEEVLMKVISINLLPISLLYLCVKFKTTPAKTKAFNKCKTTTNSSKHSQLELWQEIRVWIRGRQKQLTKCAHFLSSSRNLELHSCTEKQYLRQKMLLSPSKSCTLISMINIP